MRTLAIATSTHSGRCSAMPENRRQWTLDVINFDGTLADLQAKHYPTSGADPTPSLT